MWIMTAKNTQKHSDSAIRRSEDTAEKQKASGAENLCVGRAELDLQYRLLSLNFCGLAEPCSGRI